MIKLGDHADWTKSSYSGPHGDCVEVRSTAVITVDVQDSKRTDSPVIAVSPAAFAAFVSSVRI